MAIEKIDLECNHLPAKICCPVCGAVIHSEHDDPPRCKHVVFSYITEIGDFDHVAPSIEGIVAEAREREKTEQEAPVEFVLNQLDSGSVLCWSITVEGHTCGPFSMTIWIAVDFEAE